MTATAGRQTLAEITDQHVALDQLLVESGGEVTPEIEQWMTEYAAELREKVDHYGAAIRRLEGEAKLWQGEADFFATKAKAAANSAKAIKQLAQLAMEKLGEVEFTGERYRLCLTPNGGQQPIELLVPVEQLPFQYTKTVVTADKDMLRQDLERGVENLGAYAALAPRGYHVRVR